MNIVKTRLVGIRPLKHLGLAVSGMKTSTIVPGDDPFAQEHKQWDEFLALVCDNQALKSEVNKALQQVGYLS